MIEVNNNKVASLINALQVNISEYCFSNLFCFQGKHSFKYINTNGLPFISGSHSNLNYLMPLFEPTKQNIQQIYLAILENGSTLYPISETWVNVFSEDNRFTVNSYTKDFDYVFSKEKLANMSGRKLSKKRNLISQFSRNCNEIIIKPFSNETINHALEILETWEKDSSDNRDLTDYHACVLGINNYKQLNLYGIIIYNNKKPIAFTLGEKIHDNYILHFAKANLRCKGVYQYLFQTTAQSLIDIKWINFEQDLGNPSLQKMKMSYYPDMFIKKYTISLASDN